MFFVARISGILIKFLIAPFWLLWCYSRIFVEFVLISIFMWIIILLIVYFNYTSKQYSIACLCVFVKLLWNDSELSIWKSVLSRLLLKKEFLLSTFDYLGDTQCGGTFPLIRFFIFWLAEYVWQGALLAIF